MHRTWKYFDMLIVLGALLLGSAVWFIPNFTQSPEFVAMQKTAEQRKAAKAASEAAKMAEDARLKKQHEEEGIVYFGPTDKFFPGDHAREKPVTPTPTPAPKGH